MPAPWTHKMMLAAREHYFERSLGIHDLERIQEKYEVIGTSVADHQPLSSAQCRMLASKYPGVLRELEMCAPSTTMTRRTSAQQLSALKGASFRSLLDDPQYAPLVLWNDVHSLLKDILVWRSGPGSSEPSSCDFGEWASQRSLSALPNLWPSSSTPLYLSQEQRPNQRTAYAWLARLVDMTEDALLGVLLDKLGARRS